MEKISRCAIVGREHINQSINQSIPTHKDAKQALRESHALFARWTTDFDLPYPTEWWYCLKEQFTPLEQLTAKQRYRINKGLRNCEIAKIKRQEYHQFANQVADVAQKSFEDYPKQYRTTFNKENYSQYIQNLPQDEELWLCKENQTGEIIGFAICKITGTTVNLQQVKVPTNKLNTEANAAIVYKLTEYYLQDETYRCMIDGERNIRHITNYQDYLVKVFNFRYAYCRLNICYSPLMDIAVKILYPFRSFIKSISSIHPFIYNIYCVLKMEAICRTFTKNT